MAIFGESLRQGGLANERIKSFSLVLVLLLIGLYRYRFLQVVEVPMIGTCVDITAEALQQGQDPRGSIMAFFRLTKPAKGVRWISQHRITITAVSINGIGLTKLDRARLQLWSMFRMKVPHE